MNISIKKMASMIDQTILKSNVTLKDLEKFCIESSQYEFKALAINCSAIEICKKHLNKSNILICTVVGFPLGQSTIESKIFETQDAINKNADEIDYVINITQLKAKNYTYIENEMKGIVDICRNNNKISKVIFETCFLTDYEKTKLCEIALNIKPNFVKTSTGFGTYGATIEDIELMKSIVKDNIKIKASGGIRDLKTAEKMISAGADRIGTSAGIKIIEELKLKQPRI
ncbi:MAG: deoxyribose-phosphate aldolase [Clostridiales bacterium]